jgi:hypothetical protein
MGLKANIAWIVGPASHTIIDPEFFKLWVILLLFEIYWVYECL